MNSIASLTVWMAKRPGWLLALLYIAAYGVLPELRHLIVDKAEHLSRSGIYLLTYLIQGLLLTILLCYLLSVVIVTEVQTAWNRIDMISAIGVFIALLAILGMILYRFLNPQKMSGLLEETDTYIDAFDISTYAITILFLCAVYTVLRFTRNYRKYIRGNKWHTQLTAFLLLLIFPLGILILAGNVRKKLNMQFRAEVIDHLTD